MFICLETNSVVFQVHKLAKLLNRVESYKAVQRHGLITHLLQYISNYLTNNCSLIISHAFTALLSIAPYFMHCKTVYKLHSEAICNSRLQCVPHLSLERLLLFLITFHATVTLFHTICTYCIYGAWFQIHKLRMHQTIQLL